MKILEKLKKKWETAQFIIIAVITLLTAIWNGIIYNISGYTLNDNVLAVGVGVLATSGVLAILVTMIKD
jgi:hypothetical protein